MRAAEPLPEDLVYDTRLLFERRTGRFYLCLLSPLEKRGETPAPASSSAVSSSSVMARDP